MALNLSFKTCNLQTKGSLPKQPKDIAYLLKNCICVPYLQPAHKCHQVPVLWYLLCATVIEYNLNCRLTAYNIFS